MRDVEENMVAGFDGCGEMHPESGGVALMEEFLELWVHLVQVLVQNVVKIRNVHLPFGLVNGVIPLRHEHWRVGGVIACFPERVIEGVMHARWCDAAADGVR
jgi:hypothetical protein